MDKGAAIERCFFRDKRAFARGERAGQPGVPVVCCHCLCGRLERSGYRHRLPLQPVSYTHLDVYKRQAYAFACEACRLMDKAASKGVIHKNQAANRKSGIMRLALSLIHISARAGR